MGGEEDVGTTSGIGVGLTDGGASVAHAGESVLKQPDTYIVDDVVSVKAVANVGVWTKAAVLPGSMDGPPG